jgi:lysophospholipase L1-like esterase
MARNILIIAQSNGVGEAPNANLQAQYNTPNTSVKIWDGSAFSTLTTSNNLYPSGSGSATFGCEFSLGYKLQAYYNDTINIIKYVWPGTSLASDSNANGDWSISNRGELYDKATSTFNEAMAFLWANKSRPVLDAIIWIQGEADSRVLASANAYQTNLTNFISQLRLNTGGNCPFIILQVHNGINNATAGTSITGATNANPIVITTSAAHNITSGQSVRITGVVGNTAANTTAIATVLSTTTFSIPVAGNGAYTSGGTVFAYPYWSTVASAEATVATSVSNCYLINTDSYTLQSDNVHFDAAGYEQMGLDIKNQIISLIP